MTNEKDVCYAFGGFQLGAANRSLLLANQPVELPAKSFDLLFYLIKNADRFVPADELIKNVWSDSPMHLGSIRKQIARIRKVLNDDWRRPTFVKTMFSGRGYRFIKPVNIISGIAQKEALGLPNADSASHPANIRVTAHIFVPVYLGPDLIREIRSPAKASRWLSYKEFKIENGRLCLLPSGVAVWHIWSEESFARLADFAAWRKKTYEEIFQGKHRIIRYMTDLIGKGPWSANSIFKSVFGKPGYGYTAVMLDSPRSKDPSRVRTILELLACPKPLEPTVNTQHESGRLHQLEMRFLENGLNTAETREFGLAGEDMGFASWEGLSYYNQSPHNLESKHDILEFQIAVHALWWLGKCLSDVWLAEPLKAVRTMKSFIPDFKRQYMTIRNIGAKETVSQRTMSEAVLAMNRVNMIIQETLDLYR